VLEALLVLLSVVYVDSNLARRWYVEYTLTQFASWLCKFCSTYHNLWIYLQLRLNSDKQPEKWVSLIYGMDWWNGLINYTRTPTCHVIRQMVHCTCAGVASVSWQASCVYEQNGWYFVEPYIHWSIVIWFWKWNL